MSQHSPRVSYPKLSFRTFCLSPMQDENEVRCKYSDQGCEVKMMLKPLLSHEDTCLKVKRRCKHSDKGCKVRLTLKDLKVHEKSCPERTFKCPYNNCGSIIRLEDFDEHALNTPRPDFDSHSVFGDSNFRLPISVREERLKPKLKLSMSEFPLFNLFRGNFDPQTKPVHVIKKRQMHCVRAHGELFHVRLDYHQPQHCFVLSIWTAKSELGATKFRADVKIDYPHFNFKLDDKDPGIVQKVCSSRQLRMFPQLIIAWWRMENTSGAFLSTLR